ncbi:MAG: hypothetical protein ABI885_29995 [Gammaproteobacteria bacterium]
MQPKQLFSALISIAALTAGFNSPARADADEFSPADLALIRSYTLSTDFLEKWKAMNQDPQVLPCNLNALSLDAETIDERAKEYDARPGVHASLVVHDLTAREVVLATTNIAVAGLQALREKMSWLDDDGDDPLPVSAASVEFYRQHADEIRQLKNIASKRSRENRGKGARCPD